jgi:hypothetical protein
LISVHARRVTAPPQTEFGAPLITSPGCRIWSLLPPHSLQFMCSFLPKLGKFLCCLASRGRQFHASRSFFNLALGDHERRHPGSQKLCPDNKLRFGLPAYEIHMVVAHWYISYYHNKHMWTMRSIRVASCHDNLVFLKWLIPWMPL